jgi:hypothetical protein
MPSASLRSSRLTQHQCLGADQRGIDPRQQGQTEGNRLATASGCLRDQITSRQSERQGGALDWSGLGVIEGSKPGAKCGVEAEVIKTVHAASSQLCRLQTRSAHTARSERHRTVTIERS